MKCVISTTYSDTYLYFLPIVTWCWNRLGVDVICFLPQKVYQKTGIEGLQKRDKISLVTNTIMQEGMKCMAVYFDAPEHKEATYAQCSRLYGACLDLPEDEILITGDVDMCTFSALINCIDMVGNNYGHGIMTAFGSDLVPDGQVPICYVWGSVKEWRKCYTSIYGEEIKTYQEYLDLLLGSLQSEHFRGNHWSKDQEEMNLLLSKTAKIEINRARPGTQFASNRVDRDDINWRAYVNDELVDAHLWRPGYTEENFANIMELLTMKYPNDDFTWLRTYNEQYKALL